MMRGVFEKLVEVSQDEEIPEGLAETAEDLVSADVMNHPVKMDIFVDSSIYVCLPTHLDLRRSSKLWPNRSLNPPTCRDDLWDVFITSPRRATAYCRSICGRRPRFRLIYPRYVERSKVVPYANIHRERPTTRRCFTSFATGACSQTHQRK